MKWVLVETALDILFFFGSLEARMEKTELQNLFFAAWKLRLNPQNLQKQNNMLILYIQLTSLRFYSPQLIRFKQTLL